MPEGKIDAILGDKFIDRHVVTASKQVLTHHGQTENNLSGYRSCL